MWLGAVVERLLSSLVSAKRRTSRFPWDSVFCALPVLLHSYARLLLHVAVASMTQPEPMILH